MSGINGSGGAGVDTPTKHRGGGLALSADVTMAAGVCGELDCAGFEPKLSSSKRAHARLYTPYTLPPPDTLAPALQPHSCITTITARGTWIRASGSCAQIMFDVG